MFLISVHRCTSVLSSKSLFEAKVEAETKWLSCTEADRSASFCYRHFSFGVFVFVAHDHDCSVCRRAPHICLGSPRDAVAQLGLLGLPWLPAAVQLGGAHLALPSTRACGISESSSGDAFFSPLTP